MGIRQNKIQSNIRVTKKNIPVKESDNLNKEYKKISPTQFIEFLMSLEPVSLINDGKEEYEKNTGKSFFNNPNPQNVFDVFNKLMDDNSVLSFTIVSNVPRQDIDLSLKKMDDSTISLQIEKQLDINNKNNYGYLKINKKGVENQSKNQELNYYLIGLWDKLSKESII